MKAIKMIPRLNYTPDTDWQAFSSHIRDHLMTDGVVVVLGLPAGTGSNSILPRLVNSLGSISLADIPSPDTNNPLVNNIEAAAKPVRDRLGNVVLSSTSERFPCHTDDYFLDRPSDVVFLQCIRSAAIGGDSLVSRLSDIIIRLDDATIECLAQRIFPTHFGHVAILTNEDSRMYIRYNRIQIERSSELLHSPLGRDSIDALDHLDDAIFAVQERLRLGVGDCLILNNRTVVHGRTAFPHDSRRLLTRVKAYL